MISFDECIKDLISKDEVQKLDNFSQHFFASRLDHSLDVAKITYKTCARLKLNDVRIKEATVAALLHDLFLYDWRDVGHSSKEHTFAHPKNACLKAKEITNLSKKQENIILSHMFPLCTEIPKSLEAWIVQYADKVSALHEYIKQYGTYSLQLKPVIYLFNVALILHI